MTAAAAAGVIGMAVLTGCLGEDDKNKNSNPLGSPSDKKPTSTATDTKSSDEPTSKSSTAPSRKPTGSGQPTSTSTDSTSINKLDLKVGDCVDFDATDKMSKASCTGPHDAETVGVFQLPESMSPVSPTFEDDIQKKCMDTVNPVIQRQSNAAKLSGTFVYPTVDSWIRGNDKTLQCFVVNRDDTPLPAGKLK